MPIDSATSNPLTTPPSSSPPAVPNTPQSSALPAPSTFGGVLANDPRKDDIRTEIDKIANRLAKVFLDANPPVLEGQFRRHWVSLLEAPFIPLLVNFGGLAFNFGAESETSLRDIHVLNGTRYEDIEFVKLLLKAHEVSKHIVRTRSLSAVPTAPEPWIPQAQDLLSSFGLDKDDVELPDLPDVQPSTTSYTSTAQSGTSSTAGIYQPDGALLLERKVPASLPSASSRPKVQITSLPLEIYTRLMILVQEVKTGEEVRLGWAQSLCYLITSFELCGCWVGLLCVDKHFVRMVMLDRYTVAIETLDADRSSSTQPIWDFFRRSSVSYHHRVLHNVTDEQGRDRLVETLFDIFTMGATIPTRTPLARLPSPEDVGCWQSVTQRAINLGAEISETQLYLGAEARRSTIGKTYAYLKRLSDLRTPDADCSSKNAKRKDDTDGDGNGGSTGEAPSKARRGLEIPTSSKAAKTSTAQSNHQTRSSGKRGQSRTLAASSEPIDNGMSQEYRRAHIF